jgi:hypothetical protein
MGVTSPIRACVPVCRWQCLFVQSVFAFVTVQCGIEFASVMRTHAVPALLRAHSRPLRDDVTLDPAGDGTQEVPALTRAQSDDTAGTTRHQRNAKTFDHTVAVRNGDALLTSVVDMPVKCVLV